MGKTKKSMFQDRPEDQLEICRMYSSGDHSTISLMEVYGCSRTAIVRVLKDNGINLRDGAGKTKAGKEALSKLRKEKVARGEYHLPTPLAADRISEASRGSKNPRWKGGRTTSPKGYVYVLDPESMDKNMHGKRKYLLEHRLVIEKILGRKLLTGEHVHHINGIKSDNRPENLMIVINKMHYGHVNCPYCSREFMVR